MAKKKSRKRKRSFSEKVMIVLGIIIALSMLASLIVGLGSGGSRNAPLPESERFNETLADPVNSIGALDVDSGAPVAVIPVGATAPPLA